MNMYITIYYNFDCTIHMGIIEVQIFFRTYNCYKKKVITYYNLYIFGRAYTT